MRLPSIFPFSSFLILNAAAAHAFSHSPRKYETNNIAASPFSIERVSTLSRALDVSVFRGWSMTAEEWVEKRRNEQRLGQQPLQDSMMICTHDDAMRELMIGYDESGVNQLAFGSQRPVTFCAIAHGSKDGIGTTNDDGWMIRTNFAVGSVDCQVKTKQDKFSMRFFELKLTGGDSEGNVPDWEEDHSCEQLIPFPHVYLKNLCVDERMRGRGVGLALVRAVKAYAFETGVHAVVLDVDPSNVSAVKLYRREGFEFVKRGSMLMICYIDMSADGNGVEPILC